MRVKNQSESSSKSLRRNVVARPITEMGLKRPRDSDGLLNQFENEESPQNIVEGPNSQHFDTIQPNRALNSEKQELLNCVFFTEEDGRKSFNQLK